MIENPRDYVKFFSELGADIIYFCPDAETQPARTIDDIHGECKVCLKKRWQMEQQL